MIDALLSGGVLLILDLWAKSAVHSRRLNYCGRWGPLRIRYVANANCTQGRVRKGALIALWAAAVVSASVLHSSGWFQGHAALIGLGLAFGGAAGNLLDMLRFGYVVDFIDLRWWPVFNIADVAIVGGLVTALWSH